MRRPDMLGLMVALSAILIGTPWIAQGEGTDAIIGEWQAENDPRVRISFGTDGTYVYLTGVRLANGEPCMWGVEGNFETKAAGPASLRSFILTLKPLGSITKVPTQECVAQLQLQEQMDNAYLAFTPTMYNISVGYKEQSLKIGGFSLVRAQGLPTPNRYTHLRGKWQKPADIRRENTEQQISVPSRTLASESESAREVPRAYPDTSVINQQSNNVLRHMRSFPSVRR